MANTGSNRLNWDEFPFDKASDRVLNEARALSPTDRSPGAQHLREVAESILENREAYNA